MAIAVAGDLATGNLVLGASMSFLSPPKGSKYYHRVSLKEILKPKMLVKKEIYKYIHQETFKISGSFIYRVQQK